MVTARPSCRGTADVPCNMHCHLLDLPVELQLKIIQELVRDEDIRAHANDYDVNDIEKQDEPIKIYHDLINWSCTSSYFRNLLAPDVFKITKLVNNEKSASSLSTLAKSPHRIHLKELYFIGFALGHTYSEEAAFSDTEGILPRSVDALLRNLHWFPSLERLNIKFHVNFETIDDDDFFRRHVFETETPEQVLQAEKSVAYRALMFRTYFALMQNKPPHFKHLDIRQFIRRKVSTFSDAAFHDFLAHLEQFTLSIYFDESNLIVNEPDFEVMGKLDEYFFNHLAKVTTLSIKNSTTEHLPLGLKGGIHVPLTLQADQMPLLTALHLDHIFVSPELVDFLVGHKDTLKELALSNCWASTGADSIAHNGICWSQLFTSILSANPVQLRRFELIGDAHIPLHIPLPRVYLLEEAEDLKKLCAIPRQGPGRVFFPYADLEGMSCVLCYDREESWAAFRKMEDQESWDRLMRLVDRNAKEQVSEGQGGLRDR